MISNQLPTDYQNFIALSRYSRWKEEIYSDQNLPVPIGVGLNRRNKIEKLFDFY